MKKFYLFILLIFYFLSYGYSETTINLQLSPNKSVYQDNETISLLVSCSTTENNLKGDVYIAFITPDYEFFSITSNGIVQGIQPLVSNIKIPSSIINYKIFSFPYYSIFKNGQYKIAAAIVKSGTVEIVSNIPILNIPTSNGNSNTSLNKWNLLKKIWGKYFTPIKICAGNNFVHVLLKKSQYDYYYLRLNLKGYIVIPPFKIPPRGLQDYAPAMVADENDNVYFIYHDSSHKLWLYVIGKDGYEKKNINFYEFNREKNIYVYNRFKNIDAYYKNGKIYYTAITHDFKVKDSFDEYHYFYYSDAIVFGIVTTSGQNIVIPQPISGEIREYKRIYPSKTIQKVYESDDIYTKNPIIVVDKNSIAHVFWNEHNSTLKKYFIRYFRYNPHGLSYINTVNEVGGYTKISALLDNNTIYLGYVDTTHSPKSLSMIKLSTDGEFLSSVENIPSQNISQNSDFFILKDKFGNIDVYFHNSSGYEYQPYHTIIKNDLNTVIKNNEKVFDSLPKDIALYHEQICEDKEYNFHLISTTFGSAKNVFYSNTNYDNSSFLSKPDLVISPSSFKCSPSNNVKVGGTITCSFEVANVTEYPANGGSVNVEINNQNIFTENFTKIDSFETKTFTFQYSPTDPHTPEYPEINITVTPNFDELTSINNKITPTIRVRPVPNDVSFKIYVYDDTYNPTHDLYLERISDAICVLYDKSTGDEVATALLNQFKNIPIGDSESEKKVYILKCNKNGYNETTKEIEIWRDTNDPYKVNFSPKDYSKIYMHKWGNLHIELSYYDENGNEKPLNNATLYFSGKDYSKTININGSSIDIQNIPVGRYKLIIEKENYNRIEDNNIEIKLGQVIEKSYFTTKTTKGDIKISIRSNNGYIIPSSTLKIEKNSQIVKTINVQNGNYRDKLEKGSYQITASSNNYYPSTKTFTVKAGLLNTLEIDLTPQQQEEFNVYSRKKDVTIVAFPNIAEWPSTPLTDGFKVSNLNGVFQIEANFIGKENDNKIYSLDQLFLKIVGKGATYFSVESSWDPTSLVDLPEEVELYQNICEIQNLKESIICDGFPLAIDTDIAIKLGGYIGKTMVRVDKIIIEDDKGHKLFESNTTFYSDTEKLFNINSILDEESSYIIADIYLKVGEQDNITGEFKSTDILGNGHEYIKISYKVPRVKPEYGWYYYNIVNGQYEKTNFTNQYFLPSNLYIIKYKPFNPYTITIFYINENY